MNSVEIMLKNIKEKPENISKRPDDWAACINFVNIPKSLLTVMTVTMMEKGRKKMYPRTEFQSAMSIVENRLQESRKEYESSLAIPDEERLDCNKAISHDDIPYDLFEPTWDWMQSYKAWYAKLNVHRCYFVPKNSIGIILKHMWVHEILGGFWHKGIKQVVFVIPELPEGGVAAANGVCGVIYRNTYDYPLTLLTGK